MSTTTSPADLQERFQWKFAHLFHAIGHRVACAEGCGVLEQVFSDHAVVRLDNGKTIAEPDLECILVDELKSAPAPAPSEVKPGPYVATDDEPTSKSL